MHPFCPSPPAPCAASVTTASTGISASRMPHRRSASAGSCRRSRPPPWDGRARRDGVRADRAAAALPGRHGEVPADRRGAGRRHPHRERVDAGRSRSGCEAAGAGLRPRRRADARVGGARRPTTAPRSRGTGSCTSRSSTGSGQEGFAVLDGVPQNLGVLDQQAALRWVRREIARVRRRSGARHGDGTLRGCQHAHGAARAAARGASSSTGRSCRAVRCRAQPPKKAGRMSRAIAKRLGAPATRAGFAAVEPSALADAQTAVAAGGSPLGGGPTVALAIGGEAVPGGSARRTHRGRRPRHPGAHRLHQRGVPAVVRAHRCARADPLVDGHARAARVARAARGSCARIAPAGRPRPPGEVLGEIVSDLLLRGPITRFADSRVGGPAPTYVYEFRWRSPVDRLGAAHAMELGFVFDGSEHRMPSPSAARTLRRRSPTPCTGPGSRSSSTATPAGRHGRRGARCRRSTPTAATSTTPRARMSSPGFPSGSLVRAMTSIDDALELDRAIPDIDWHVFPAGTVHDVFAAPSGGLARVRLGDPDAPRVVLISGVAGSKEDFILLFPLFAAAGYRVESYDIAGHYGSVDAGPQNLDPPREHYDYRLFVDDLIAILEDGRTPRARPRLQLRRPRRRARARRAARALREPDADGRAARDRSGVPRRQAHRADLRHAPAPRCRVSSCGASATTSTARRRCGSHSCESGWR